MCPGVAAALREPGLGAEGPGLAAVRAASGAARWTVTSAGLEVVGVLWGLGWGPPGRIGAAEGTGFAAVRAESGAVRWTLTPAGPEAAGVPGRVLAPAAAAVGPMAVGADPGVASPDTERCTATRPEAARGPDGAAPGLVGRDGATWTPARPDGSPPATAPFDGVPPRMAGPDGVPPTAAGPDGAPPSTVWLGGVSATTVWLGGAPPSTEWTDGVSATTVWAGGASPMAAWPGEAALPGVRPDAEPPDTVGRPPGVASTAAVRPSGDGAGALPVAVGPSEASPGVPPAIAAPSEPVLRGGAWDGRAAGRVRRWTAGSAALVNGAGREVRGGGTGVTRGPAGRDGVTSYGARCTGRASPGASARGTGSSLATGRVREGSSRPATGVAEVVSTFLTSPPGAPGSTAWVRVPVKEGFCQVLNRPLNPVSATVARPSAVRRIGASPSQPRPGAPRPPGAAGTAGAEAGPSPAPEAGRGAPSATARPAADVTSPPERTSPARTPPERTPPEPTASAPAPRPVPPRSRSRNPTCQPSAPPRVTRDAICSV